MNMIFTLKGDLTPESTTLTLHEDDALDEIRHWHVLALEPYGSDHDLLFGRSHEVVLVHDDPHNGEFPITRAQASTRARSFRDGDRVYVIGIAPPEWDDTPIPPPLPPRREVQ